MADEALARKLTLPRICRVALENFDLYSLQPNADVRVERNVFCLIGANGLGKSTFLNTLNFCVTGAVPDPARKFQSAPEYYRDSSRASRTEDYFGGRISEEKRPIATVTVELAWPTKIITATRNIFQGSKVAKISLTDVPSNEVETVTAVDSADEAIPQSRYESEVLKLTGLEDFAQFVFLFHFVSTFDEGRHLLMWDRGALTNALYLAFGADPTAAKAADKLQHDMDRESSRGRNVRFSARHVTTRIEQLSGLLKGTETDDHVSQADLQRKHQALLDRQTAAEERVRSKQNEMRDADLRWTNLSASLTETQLEYRRLFSARVQKSASVAHHPVIRTSLAEDRCAVCGASHIAAKLQGRIDSGSCPLCESPLDSSPGDAEAIAALREIDTKLIALQNNLSSVLVTRQRLSSELNSAEADEASSQEDVKRFENQESARLATPQAGGFSAIMQEIARLEREREEFRIQSEAHYKKRDALREKLRVYEKKLKAHYEIGSERFVPRFRELAEAFIGIPIDVELEHHQGTNISGFGLKLSMNETLRSRPDEVSESQRFFIDIALRMALAEFMSDGPATILIDTPEGSLDIAYEARAGVMFSKFAETNRILMTANIRSSQLVLRLAGLQGKAGMQIVRMTDWTDLSEVQQSEEKLFSDAYQTIDAAMN